MSLVTFAWEPSVDPDRDALASHWEGLEVAHPTDFRDPVLYRGEIRPSGGEATELFGWQASTSAEIEVGEGEYEWRVIAWDGTAETASGWRTLTVGVTSASTYYVHATAGSDSNPGSEESPFRTLSHAISQASGGDLIRPARGEVWREHLVVDASVSFEPYGEGGATPRLVSPHAPLLTPETRGLWYLAGDLADSSGNDRSLTAVGGDPDFIVTPMDRGVRLDGVRLESSDPAFDLEDDDFTVEISVRIPASPADGTYVLFSRSDGTRYYQLQAIAVSGHAYLQALVHDGANYYEAPDWTTPWSDGDWHSVAVRMDRAGAVDGNLSLLVDGNVRGSAAAAGIGSLTATASLTLGALSGGGNPIPADWEIDHVRVVAAALPADALTPPPVAGPLLDVQADNVALGDWSLSRAWGPALHAADVEGLSWGEVDVEWGGRAEWGQAQVGAENVAGLTFGRVSTVRGNGGGVRLENVSGISGDLVETDEAFAFPGLEMLGSIGVFGEIRQHSIRRTRANNGITLHKGVVSILDGESAENEGDGYDAFGDSELTVIRGRATDNVLLSDLTSGDGFSSHDTAALHMVRCLSARNGKAGVNHVQQATGTLYHCVIEENHTPDWQVGYGIGVVAFDEAEIVGRNNIIRGHPLEVYASPDASIDLDYTIYDREANDEAWGAGASVYDWDGWQSLGLDLHGILGDPLLDVDYAPLPGSPAIDAGVVVPGVNDDYSGSAPDIGSVEVMPAAEFAYLGHVSDGIAQGGSTFADVEIPEGCTLAVLFSGTRPTISGAVGRSFVFDPGGPAEAAFIPAGVIDNAAANMEVWLLEDPPAGVTADLVATVDSDTAVPLGLYFFGGEAPRVRVAEMFAGTASGTITASASVASSPDEIVLAALAVLRDQTVNSQQTDDSAIQGFNSTSARTIRQFHAHKDGDTSVSFGWQIVYSGNSRDYAGAVVPVHESPIIRSATVEAFAGVSSASRTVKVRRDTTALQIHVYRIGRQAVSAVTAGGQATTLIADPINGNTGHTALVHVSYLLDPLQYVDGNGRITVAATLDAASTYLHIGVTQLAGVVGVRSSGSRSLFVSGGAPFSLMSALTTEPGDVIVEALSKNGSADDEVIPQNGTELLYQAAGGLDLANDKRILAGVRIADDTSEAISWLLDDDNGRWAALVAVAWETGDAPPEGPEHSASVGDSAPVQSDAASGVHTELQHSAAASSANPAQFDSAEATHATAAHAAVVGDSTPAQTDSADLLHLGPTHTATAGDQTPAQSDEATAGLVGPLHAASAAEQAPAQSDAATGAFTSLTITAVVGESSPIQADSASSLHEAPSFVASVAEANPGQADAASGLHVEPLSTATAAEVNAAQLDTASARFAALTQYAEATEANPAQSDTAEGVYTEPRHGADAEDVTPAQMDSVTGSFVTIQHRAQATDVSPAQADSVAGRFGTTHRASAVDANPSPSDAVHAEHAAPLFWANVADSNPAQVDLVAAWLDVIRALAYADEANPAQSDSVLSRWIDIAQLPYLTGALSLEPVLKGGTAARPSLDGGVTLRPRN